MKRTNTSGRALSSVALAMMTRLVCLSKSGASEDFMIRRVLPASSSATPDGAPAQPASTCPLLVAVMVTMALPIGGGLEFALVVLGQGGRAGRGGGAFVQMGAGLTLGALGGLNR